MRHASLFSGIGGPEVAAAMLGWENVFHCEINEFGRKVLEYWFPNSHSYEDIKKTSFKQYRGTIDVLTGGFPCQPFSYAGKRGGQQDQRYLWPEMLRVINEVRPTWVVGENVAGIGTMVEQCRITDLGSEATLFETSNGVHRYSAEFTFTIERICKDLESEGYSVQPMLIPACAVGAPHRRDRIFFIAHLVADSSNHGDMRVSGANEAKEAKERISERNEVQWFDEPTDVRSSISASFADTTSCGSESHGKSEEAEGSGSNSISQQGCRREQTKLNNGLFGLSRLYPGQRWEGFPAVSPIHRGNDGIPFDVDSLTIPFTKWRSESLKAYGNAIVPQVMYRLFEAIEKNKDIW